jgi:hypothetical protein
MNDGDWVESCTALVEHHDGKWEIVTWTQENDNESSEVNKEDVSSNIGTQTKKRKKALV